MSGAGRWSDLTARGVSALVLVALGFAEIWIGGVMFNLFIAAICGVMTWELLRMLAPDNRPLRLGLGAASAVALMVSLYVPGLIVALVLAVPVVVGYMMLSSQRLVFAGYTLLILVAGYSMIGLRADYGVVWMLWLIVVVVATDVAGYFAGKALGGPKFWPAISPNKTWSGTVAGWIAAGLVGAGFAAVLGGGLPLVLLSVAMSMAAQAGDIAESAIKRRAGVKDSSSLIPGHGGLMDRFDGMLGAAMMVIAVRLVIGVPEGLG